MSENTQNILAELNKMAIFKMSLGSKELFHSNFLEYLWDVDNSKFIRVINKLYGSDVLNVQSSNCEYYLSREKENFDLCIYHEEYCGKKGRKLKKPRIRYDLIIENKVKSIPNQKQLESYERETGGQAKYLLLSLIENFGNKEEIAKRWAIVNYKNLSDAIMEQYGELNEYIKDYCNFTKLMHNLQMAIVPNSNEFLKQPLWPDYKEYKLYRLHDLYIKQRGLKFMTLLKEKLGERKISYKDVSEAGTELRKTYKGCDEPCVYLNWNVFNAEGQIAAFIYRGGAEIFEIVIQGNHYKHGINYANETDGKIFSLDSNKVQSRHLIWDKIKGFSFMKDLTYPNQNDRQYCGYGTDCVYRYYKINENEETWGKDIENLLNYMVEDIVCVIKTLG